MEAQTEKLDAYLVDEVCAELSIKRPYDGLEDEEFIPTSYPLEYALNARLMWNKHGLFPNGLCYDAQDPALIDDIKRLNGRFGYHVERLKEYAGKEWGGDDDLFGGADDMPGTSLSEIRG